MLAPTVSTSRPNPSDHDSHAHAIAHLPTVRLDGYRRSLPALLKPTHAGIRVVHAADNTGSDECSRHSASSPASQASSSPRAGHASQRHTRSDPPEREHHHRHGHAAQDHPDRCRGHPDRETCTSRTGGYTARYPAGWVTESATPAQACHFFAAKPFAVTTTDLAAGDISIDTSIRGTYDQLIAALHRPEQTRPSLHSSNHSPSTDAAPSK